MNDYYAKSRNTNVAQEIESFLDNYTKAEYAEGFDTLMATLEDVAESIDQQVGQLESEILELKNQIEQLEETV